jgi:putative ABC transport system substrate-binding protein
LARGPAATLALALVLLAAPLAAEAQPAGRVWRIGYFAPGAQPPDALPPAALREGLQALGYVEGKNITFISRWAEAKMDRMPRLAEEIVRSNVDLIVTLGGPPSEAAKAATSTVPIVMTGAGDAVGIGLVASLARPGGNLTGVTDNAADLSAKRLGLLKEAVPTASRIAILWNAADRAMTLRYQEIERAANLLRVTVQALGVREPDDFDGAFAAMLRVRPDALFLVTDALTSLNRRRIFEFTAAHRIPAMYEFEFLVQTGGLMSYGPKLDDSFRRAAFYVDRILKGAKPGDIPVEQPTRYYLFINLKTAKALGLSIPPSILLRADHVIE